MVSEGTRAAPANAAGDRGGRTAPPGLAPHPVTVEARRFVMSRRLWPCPGTIQLQQVVRETDHAPLCADVRETAERKAPEPAAVFDVRKDGFDDRFAPPIDRVAQRGAQLRPHQLARFAAPIGRWWPPTKGDAMAGPVRRDVGVDAARVRRPEIRLAEESRIRGEHGGALPGVGLE